MRPEPSGGLKRRIFSFRFTSRRGRRRRTPTFIGVDVPAEARRDALAGPAVTVARDKPIPVQDAGNEIIIGDQHQLTYGLDDIGGGAVALPAPALEQAQLTVGAAQPVDDENDLGGRVVDIGHDLVDQGAHNALLDTGRGQFNVAFVDQSDDRLLTSTLKRSPSLVLIETPSNPLVRVVDIRAVALQAKAVGAKVAVDNTFLSPALQRPIALGADFVIHSTTKYLNGHSDIVGGAVVAADKVDVEALSAWANITGVTGAPFDAYLTLRGLRSQMRTFRRDKRAARDLRAANPGRPAHEQCPDRGSRPPRGTVEIGGARSNSRERSGRRYPRRPNGSSNERPCACDTRFFAGISPSTGNFDGVRDSGFETHP